MPQIGPLEILVVGVLALLVFGPEKLPEMARSVGKGMAQMKAMASDMKSEFDLGQEQRPPATPSTEPALKAETSDEPVARPETETLAGSPAKVETSDEPAEPPVKASAASE